MLYIFVSDYGVFSCVIRIVRIGEELGGVLGEFQAVPLNFVMQVEVRGESQFARWDRFFHNTVNIVANCVQPSTQDTYAVGWERWVKFSNWFGTHPYLESVPTGWYDQAALHLIKFKDL